MTPMRQAAPSLAMLAVALLAGGCAAARRRGRRGAPAAPVAAAVVAAAAPAPLPADLEPAARRTIAPTRRAR